jgi:antitoxin component YwqK of YwqJK toxin-antitoxin module
VKSEAPDPTAPPRRRVRPLLLALLWAWAILVFVVLDLFLDVEEFDRVRPDAALYQGMRRAAHKMVGTPDSGQGGSESLASSGGGSSDGSPPATAVERPPPGRPLHRHLVRGVDKTYVKYGTFTQWNDPKGKKSSGEYSNGRRDGVWVWVWPDGSKQEERHYEDGVLEGKVSSWYENGQMMGEEEYHLGTPHGAWRTWHPDGTHASEEHYANGVLDGALEHWHANGKPAAKATYDKGTPLGVMTFWHPNGELAERGEFLDGKRVGRWTRWDERGRVVKEEVFRAE